MTAARGARHRVRSFARCTLLRFRDLAQVWHVAYIIIILPVCVFFIDGCRCRCCRCAALRCLSHSSSTRLGRFGSSVVSACEGGRCGVTGVVGTFDTCRSVSRRGCTCSALERGSVVRLHVAIHRSVFTLYRAQWAGEPQRSADHHPPCHVVPAVCAVCQRMMTRLLQWI